MNLRLLVVSIVGALALFLATATAARAQSAIAGAVRDSTGAVMPGVTVEVSGPALIERTRTAITDGQGLYQVVNLPPGTYGVTFTLPGFTTVQRSDVDVPGNFTATVNADLRVGSLEETVIVSGASPVVDVQSTAKAQVINRDLLDALPTGKTAQTMGALVPGIIIGTPDVGGSGSMNQNAQTMHGMGAKETVVLLDGIQLNGMCGNGTTQSYSNTQHYEEIVYQTSGAGADIAAGGVRQLIIPRRGGNEFHGSFSGVWADGSWQSDNLSDDLIRRGLTAGNRIDNVYTFEGGFGGRIIRDKLWFFAAARKQSVNEFVADAFYPDGSQGINDQYVKNIGARLTWQINQKNQLSAYVDRVWKFLGHADMSAGYDPATASRVWVPSPLYQQSQAKWTSTLSSRLLFEAGYNQYQAQRNSTYQPGVEKPYGSPEWYAGANRNDTSRGTNTTAHPSGHQVLEPIRNFFATSLSYVSGSHNIKAGVQKGWGFENFGTVEFNAALRQIYQNAVPTSVVVSNAPVRYNNVLKGDWGVYGQDAWTLRRLTLNYGIRWERFESYIGRRGEKPIENGTSRFVALPRTFGPETMPVWATLSPRFGLVYDLFGDAKTALKFSANKYQMQLTDGLTNTYNPVRPQTASLTWRDLNNDDIAQGELGCTFMTPGCEINLGQLPANFGLTPAGCTTLYAPGNIPCGNSQIDPDIKRDYSVHYSVGVQHALLPTVSVMANWYHVDFYNLQTTANVRRTAADYTPVQIASPLDGSAVTMYNVSSAKVNQVLDVAINDPDRRRWNNSLDITFNARLLGGSRLFGGVAFDRTLETACGDVYIATDPNRRNYCDQSLNDIPWHNQFKLAGSTQLPWRIQLSAALQSYTKLLSTTLNTQWQITPTTRYPADCLGACMPGAIVNPGMTVAQLNVPLEAPGARLGDRVNQLDVNLGKWLNAGRFQVQPTLAIFNALNSAPVYEVRSFNYLTTSYLQPSLILQPRMYRVGVDMKW
jgi:Carboxypeptidase regulatory-like domain/TonB-dependent Receptor Plug Domain